MARAVLGRTCRRCGADSWQPRSDGFFRCGPCNVRYALWWNRQNPERHRKHRAHSTIRRTYNIEPAEYQRRKRKHRGRCAICRRRQLLCYDHDHKTGRYRGFLCNACNKALGLLQDDVKRMHRAISYLRRNHV